MPTLAEAGVPGYEANNWWGVLAPAGTPAAISSRLRTEITAILESPEMRRRFEAEGGEAAHASVQEFAGHIAAETAKWSRVVKEAGIKAE